MTMNTDDKLICEAYLDRDRDDFRMSDEDFKKAEKELKGTRLSQFIKLFDIDEHMSVSLHVTYVQKHYGKIHSTGRSPVTGDSIADAVRGLGGGGLESELKSEERMAKGYIVTNMEIGEDAEREKDKQSRTSASVAKHYSNLDRGETNYRGD